MFSVVLMMAMTGTVDAPTALFNKGCCGGCYGCCGGYSCCGGCFGCCGGYSCCGGKHHRSKHCCGGWSCCGGCCGGYSCCGGCCGGYSCCGGKHHHRSKHCCGGYSCHGCCGGYYGCCGGCCGGYMGCCGGFAGCCGGCCGGAIINGGVAPVIAAPVTTPAPATKKTKEVKANSAPATIVVSLPADARLLIDDAATTSTSERRVFVSPTLPAGKEFHYTLKAEFVREGKTMTVSREVAVRAGDETNVDLNSEIARVASR